MFLFNLEFKIISVDEDKNGCELIYKGKRFHLWYDWHDGHHRCHDDRSNTFFVSVVEGKDPRQAKEFYNSQEFKNVFISDRLFDEYRKYGCTRITDVKGNQIRQADLWHELSNVKGVCYKDGKYIYVEADSNKKVSIKSFSSVAAVDKFLKGNK